MTVSANIMLKHYQHPNVRSPVAYKNQQSDKIRINHIVYSCPLIKLAEDCPLHSDDEHE